MFILFDDVSSESLISSMLDEIESDEERRRQVVGEMIDLLDRDGIDASSARRMKINAALDPHTCTALSQSLICGAAVSRHRRTLTR